MTTITITMRVSDESANPDDYTGLTPEAYDEIADVLLRHGYNIDIRKDTTP